MTPALKRRLAVGAALAGMAIVLGVAGLLAAAEMGGAQNLVRAALQAKLHRPVAFGHARVHLLSHDPVVELTDLRVASPREITPDDLLHARSVILHPRLGSLLLGRFDLRSVSVADGTLDLVRLGHGRNNYTFGSGGSGRLLGGAQSLSVTDSQWRMRDPDRHILLHGPLQHDGAPGVALPLVMRGAGTISEEPVSVIMRGAPLNGRAPKAPWPVVVAIADGDAAMEMKGSAQAPFDFRGFALDVTAKGPNLAVLGALLRTEVPNSPPFTLTTHAERDGHVVKLSAIKGRLGGSDVTGAVTNDHSQARRQITADLAFGTLRAADLAVIASPPAPHAVSRSQPGAKPTSGEVLGLGKPYPLKAMRELDTQVDLKAARVEGYALPLHDLHMTLSLAGGELRAHPVSFQLPSGAVAADIAFDATRPTPSGQVHGSLRGARIAALRPKLRSVVDGVLDASVDLSASGASPQAMMSGAGGQARFRVTDGRLQKAPAAVLGGDPLNAVALAFGGKGMEPLNCAVGTMSGKGGVFHVDRLVMATRSGTAVGQGEVDIGAGRLRIRLQGHPSRRFATQGPPVEVSGPLSHPKVSVDKGGLVSRGLVGAAVAVLTAPVAALSKSPAPPPAGADCSEARR